MVNGDPTDLSDLTDPSEYQPFSVPSIGEAMVLETERLILRPVVEADAPFLYPLINDADVANNMLHVPHPYPEHDLEPWICECREAMERCECLELAIILRESGEPIGICSLLRLDWVEKHGELAYWLGKRYWGRGYMTEAVKRLVEYAFREFGLESIHGSCFARNVPSVHVMRKAGLTYMKHRRGTVQKGSRLIDVISFEISIEEFLSKKQ